MKNGKAIKRVVSSVMALAVAFTMCMVATPMKALAESSGGFTINASGEIINGESGDRTNGHCWTEQQCDISKYSYDLATGTLTMKDSIGGGNIAGTKLKVEGNCKLGSNTVSDGFSFDGSGTATIIMTKGATLTVDPNCKLKINGTTYASLTDAITANALKIDGGDASGNVITANSGAQPSGGSDVAVGDSVQEQGKTSTDSATYKVTNTDEGKRSVTYEKPAENASGTEEVKAEVTLADSKVYKVTAIADSAFSNFGGKDKITEIKICDNVEDIGANACKDCTNLTTVTFGANVKNIGANAFSGCTALKTANLNGNIETIGNSAFEATKITKVTLGKKVKKVGRKAYYKCGSLKIITVKSTKLTKKSKVGNNAFGKINKKAKVKIKMGKKDATKYKSNTIKVFKNKKIGYVNTWKVS